MANTLELVADPTRGTGSGPSGRLVRDGNIPAVLYGKGIEPVAAFLPVFLCAPLHRQDQCINTLIH